MVASSGINYFSSNRLTSIPVFLERERNVRMRQIIDIYGFQLPMTSFLAKIHTSNARRRIRETMSTEPRDSSKLISGGPRTVLLRHRARYKHTGTYMYIHAEKILTFSPARVCSPRKFVVFLKRQLPPSFHPFASKRKPLLPDGKRWKKGRRKEGIYVRGKGRGMLLIVAVGSLKRRRGQERKSGYTSVHLSTTWRRRLRGVEIGDPGSRWIL